MPRRWENINGETRDAESLEIQPLFTLTLLRIDDLKKNVASIVAAIFHTVVEIYGCANYPRYCIFTISFNDEYEHLHLNTFLLESINSG